MAAVATPSDIETTLACLEIKRKEDIKALHKRTEEKVKEIVGIGAFVGGVLVAAGTVAYHSTPSQTSGSNGTNYLVDLIINTCAGAAAGAAVCGIAAFLYKEFADYFGENKIQADYSAKKKAETAKYQTSRQISLQA